MKACVERDCMLALYLSACAKESLSVKSTALCTLVASAVGSSYLLSAMT